MVLFFNSYHNVTLTAFSFSLRNVQYCPDEGWLYIKLKRRRRWKCSKSVCRGRKVILPAVFVPTILMQAKRNPTNHRHVLRSWVQHTVILPIIVFSLLIL